MNDEISELLGFLAPYPLEVQQVALDARAYLLELLGPVTELVFDATAAVCVGFCYSDNARDNFVNIAVYAQHVTLVFMWGVRLDDPEGRLGGSGNQVRHIRLERGMETLTDPYVVGLIRQAQSMARRYDEFVPTRVVKVYGGPKRRPSSGAR